jgi:hypothetical protein
LEAVMMDKKTNNLLQLPCQLKDFVGLNTNPTGSHNPATLDNIRTQGGSSRRTFLGAPEILPTALVARGRTKEGTPTGANTHGDSRLVQRMLPQTSLIS